MFLSWDWGWNCTRKLNALLALVKLFKRFSEVFWIQHISLKQLPKSLCMENFVPNLHATTEPMMFLLSQHDSSLVGFFQGFDSNFLNWPCQI